MGVDLGLLINLKLTLIMKHYSEFCTKLEFNEHNLKFENFRSR